MATLPTLVQDLDQDLIKEVDHTWNDGLINQIFMYFEANQIFA